jgi:hypothetical protein
MWDFLKRFMGYPTHQAPVAPYKVEAPVVPQEPAPIIGHDMGGSYVIETAVGKAEVASVELVVAPVAEVAPVEVVAPVKAKAKPRAKPAATKAPAVEKPKAAPKAKTPKK